MWGADGALLGSWSASGWQVKEELVEGQPLYQVALQERWKDQHQQHWGSACAGVHYNDCL